MPVFVGKKPERVEDSGEKILQRLTSSLRSDGDFPVRAKVVTELRMLANNPNTKIDQIADIILREPSLGTRVLHLVNSTFYSRPQPIVTVTQAVMQLGMKALSDLCAGLVLMQKFVPAAQRGGIFADAVKKTIATSLLSNRFAARFEEEGIAEKGYLAGTFYNLGHLLLAFYFPQVYEAAAKRAHARNQDIAKSLNELLGITSAQLAMSIVDALKIPQYYRTVLQLSHTPPAEREGEPSELALAQAVSVAGVLAEAVVSGKSQKHLEQTIEALEKDGAVKREAAIEVLGELPTHFKQHIQLIELGFLELPGYLEHFGETAFKEGVPGRAAEGEDNGFSRYISELKLAIENREPISSLTALAMEAMLFGLKYQRVVLLYADSERTSLTGRMTVGEPLAVDVRSIHHKLDSRSDLLDVKAYYSGACELFGEPVFEDGWPFAAIPVGVKARAKGVIYGDRVERTGAPPLDESSQAALAVLVDLLDQGVAAWE